MNQNGGDDDGGGFIVNAGDIAATVNTIRDYCFALQSVSRRGLAIADLLPGLGPADREFALIEFAGNLRRTILAQGIIFSVLPNEIKEKP